MSYSIFLCTKRPLMTPEFDHCSTGEDYETLEEAREVFTAANPVKAGGFNERYYADIPFVWLDGPDVSEVRKLREPEPDTTEDDDSDWRHEQAMQAGMAFGCDGYNDEMGY